MKKMFILCLAGILSLCGATASYAQTKREVQMLIKEFITDEEYQMMLKIREATGRGWADIFDNSIEPLREDAVTSNESSRKYILPAKGEEIRPIVVTPIDNKPKPSIEVNAAPVAREADVKPIMIRPDTEAPKKKKTLYPREYKYKERLKAAQEEEAAAEAKDMMKEDAGAEEKAAEEKSLREKLKEARSLDKRRKIIDRKPRLYRSSDRRKKIEDYNRTNKPNRFSGERVDEEFEDKGFSTRAFKKKAFGSKIIYDEEETQTETEK